MQGSGSVRTAARRSRPLRPVPSHLPHLLRDISQILANEKIPILNVKMQQDNRNRIYGSFSLEITDMEQLSRVIDRIAQVKDIASVRRVQR